MPDSTTITPTTPAARLQAAYDLISACDPTALRLYLILRTPKPEVPKSRQALNKHTYEARRVDIGPDVAAALLGDVRQDLNQTLVNSEREFISYAVIDDDSAETVYCARCTEMGQAFATTVHEQVTAGVRAATVTVQQLAAEADNLWAFCLAFELPDQVVIHAFGRLGKSRFVQSESDRKSSWLTMFGSNEEQLVLMSGTTLSLPRHVAFLRFEDEFFLLRKKEAEIVMDLDDEYLTQAESLCEELEASACIDGLAHVRSVCQKSPTIIRMLTQIKRSGGYQNLTEDRISAIAALIQLHGLKVRIVGGRICIDSEDAVRHFIQLLNDYFVKSPQTGHHYGASSKRRLQTTT